MISNMDLEHGNEYEKIHYLKVRVFFFLLKRSNPREGFLLTDYNLGYFIHYLIHVFIHPFSNYQRSSIKSIILSAMEVKLSKIMILPSKSPYFPKGEKKVDDKGFKNAV